MNIFEILRTAFESLASNKLRTALTMLGVIIGVASVVTLLSLGAGVQDYIGGQLETLGPIWSMCFQVTSPMRD